MVCEAAAIRDSKALPNSRPAKFRDPRNVPCADLGSFQPVCRPSNIVIGTAKTEARKAVASTYFYASALKRR